MPTIIGSSAVIKDRLAADMIPILLLSVLPIISGQLSKSVAGPYDIIVHYMENCQKPTEKAIVFIPKLKKLNRTSIAISGDVYAGTPFDDSLTAIVHLAQFTNGGWKENFFKKDFPKACSTVKFYAPQIVQQAAKALHYKRSNCPFEKGNYTATDFILAVEVPQIPIFFYNKYKYEVTLQKNGKQIACMKAGVDVVPKKKGKG